MTVTGFESVSQVCQHQLSLFTSDKELGYLFAFVGLLVIIITRERCRRILRKFVLEEWEAWLATNDSITVVIRITMKKFYHCGKVVSILRDQHALAKVCTVRNVLVLLSTCGNLGRESSNVGVYDVILIVFCVILLLIGCETVTVMVEVES